ncbi:MAG: hypothetical protein WDN31_23150 [Hyphomicrobium sp.]
MLRAATTLLSFTIAVLIGASPLRSQEAIMPAQPILAIDASMHTAPIRAIAADASCALVATASDDKSVRLWRTPEARLLDTVRLSIGAGNNGKMFAVAVAPDASWLAAGGWTITGGEHYVYVLQTAAGTVAARFGPYKEVISKLAASPDGRYLAAALMHGQGVRVWQRTGPDLSSWRLIRDDRNFSGQDATGLAFDRDGTLYTVSLDHKLRRYKLDSTEPPLSVTTAGSAFPSSVARLPALRPYRHWLSG